MYTESCKASYLFVPFVCQGRGGGNIFFLFLKASWHRWYYPHRSRDALSPVCGIFHLGVEFLQSERQLTSFFSAVCLRSFLSISQWPCLGDGTQDKRRFPCKIALFWSNNWDQYPKLDTRISFVLRSFVCSSRSGDPPWILKRGGLESSGRMASS